MVEDEEGGEEAQGGERVGAPGARWHGKGVGVHSYL